MLLAANLLMIAGVAALTVASWRSWGGEDISSPAAETGVLIAFVGLIASMIIALGQAATSGIAFAIGMIGR